MATDWVLLRTPSSLILPSHIWFTISSEQQVLLLRSFLLSMERMLNLRNVGASEDDVKYLKLEGARLVCVYMHADTCACVCALSGNDL